jgi:hypothetical protein
MKTAEFKGHKLADTGRVPQLYVELTGHDISKDANSDNTLALAANLYVVYRKASKDPNLPKTDEAIYDEVSTSDIKSSAWNAIIDQFLVKDAADADASAKKEPAGEVATPSAGTSP